MNYCMFPATTGVINQTEGLERNGNAIDISSSHKGYKAIDISPYESKFYAPCKLKCVYHQRDNGGKSACLSVFESLEEVKCPGYSGTSKITIFCTHGGPDVATARGALRYGYVFEKDEHFYSSGTDAGINGKVGSHIHMSVKRGTFTKMSLTDINISGKQYYCLENDEFINDIFYFEPDHEITFGPYLDAIPFSFVTYSVSGEWNGWIADDEFWYYYVEGVKKTGWLEDPENSAKWFYLDPTKGGAMSTGWIKVSGVDYYMNPANGQSGHDANLPGGQMTRSKWVAGGSKWYYIKESGAMAKSESVTVNGKKYNFDSNGVCLNP